jgi:D-alanyl-D-alanine carboxypeptidase-like protein
MKLFTLFSLVAALLAPAPAEGLAPVYRSSITVIDPATRAGMVGVSWHAGCPVPIRDLRLLTLDYWGFDGSVHAGRMVVHRDQAVRVRTVFRKLFYGRFPIRRMQLIDSYGGDDHRSMAANNTSAFNCRFVSGTGHWSMHAYGRAVDLNPVQNPWVSGSEVSPRAGRPYADRSRQARGMVHGGDLVVRAFASVGWKWGGYWTGGKDYQHFSSNGR